MELKDYRTNEEPAQELVVKSSTMQELPEPPEGCGRAERIIFFNSLAKGHARLAVLAAVASGIELNIAQKECQPGMFFAWIKTSCHFSKATAYRYMALANMATGDSQIADEKATMQQLSSDPGISARLDGRSLSELYADWGIVARSSNLGGKRDGAGRPKKSDKVLPLDEDPEIQADIGRSVVAKLYDWGMTANGFSKIKTDSLAGIVRDLEDICKSATNILNVRKAEERKLK